MNDFEVIDCSEFQFHRGDLVVIGMSSSKKFIVNLSIKCARCGEYIAIFNLRNLYKQELQSVEDEAVYMNLYIDREDNPTVEYIRSKCNELNLKKALIDYHKDITYTEADIITRCWNRRCINLYSRYK